VSTVSADAEHRDQEDEMDLRQHPSIAMDLARYRMQEEIARAEAYRAARAARQERKAARDSRTIAQTRGLWLFTTLRHSFGRA